jgi:hypothetical protein
MGADSQIWSRLTPSGLPLCPGSVQGFRCFLPTGGYCPYALGRLRQTALGSLGFAIAQQPRELKAAVSAPC